MTKKPSNSLLEKCKKIKLLISDVDGILTDGGMYYSDKGEVMKKFNTKDGMGVELLRQKKIKTILMTKENSIISKKRAKKIQSDIFTGVLNKENLLKEICNNYSLKNDEIAYIGDDVNDLKIMKLVGLSATSADAINEVKQTANYVSNLAGGSGVFRDVADMILNTKK